MFFVSIVGTNQFKPITSKPYFKTCSKGLTINSVIINSGMSSGDVTQYKDINHMTDCLEKCCATVKCDLAYLIDNTCYTVNCFSKDLCKVKPVETSGVNSEITYVQRNGIELFETQDDAMVGGITSHTKESASRMSDLGKVNPMNHTETDDSIEKKKSESSNATKPITTHQAEIDTEHCEKGKTHFNVRLRGDLGAGVFAPNGLIFSMEDCASICCRNRSCDLAYMVGNNCYSVHCFSKELCQVQTASPLALNPTIAYVLRYKGSNKDQGKFHLTFRSISAEM